MSTQSSRCKLVQCDSWSVIITCLVRHESKTRLQDEIPANSVIDIAKLRISCVTLPLVITSTHWSSFHIDNSFLFCAGDTMA